MGVILDKASRVPLYLQLTQELVKKMNAGQYREYEKLPSERELCGMYELSRITVRQALQELEREGYIYKEHGKGTFVAPKSYNQRLVKLYSFTEEMKAMGKEPSTKVLSFQRLAVNERLAEKMGLDDQEDAYQVTRLRLADGEPLMYETSYLPARLFPNLTEKALTYRPMYDVFADDYQITVTKAVERFAATAVRAQEGAFLEMRENQPAMLIKRFAYQNKQLLEYTVSVARGDKFDYTVELT